MKSQIQNTNTKGFTIIEIVVMLMIMTAVSAVVLVSFTGLHEGAALNRAARELAFAIRRAQNMSFAVTQIGTQAGPVIPPAVGVRLVSGSPNYFLFADIAQDNKYSEEVVGGLIDAKVSSGEQTFEGGIKVGSLTAYDDLGIPHVTPVAHIIFIAPEAAVVLADTDGNSLGEVVEISLVSASGQLKKTIVVRTSGQVSIK